MEIVKGKIHDLEEKTTTKGDKYWYLGVAGTSGAYFPDNKNPYTPVEGAYVKAGYIVKGKYTNWKEFMPLDNEEDKKTVDKEDKSRNGNKFAEILVQSTGKIAVPLGQYRHEKLCAHADNGYTDFDSLNLQIENCFHDLLKIQLKYIKKVQKFMEEDDE